MVPELHWGCLTALLAIIRSAASQESNSRINDEEASYRIALLAVGCIVGGVLTALFTLLLLYYCGCHLHCRSELKNRLIDSGIDPKLPPSRTNQPEKRARNYAENDFSSAKNAASIKYKKKKRPQVLISEV